MMCVAVLSYIITKVYNLKGLMLLPAAALAGYLVCCSAVVPPDKTVDSYIDREIRVSGTVHSVIYNSDEGRVCFVFDGQVFDLGENRGMYDAKVRMRVYGDRPVSVGDMLVIKGRLKALSDRTNPSDFDRKSYMLARKQYYMFYADDVFICERQYGINTFMQTVKENTCRVYYNAMPEKEAGLMCGMMLGETGDIDENLSDLYKKTGIYHVIAISGLHITLLGGVLLKLFSRLGSRSSDAAADGTRPGGSGTARHAFSPDGPNIDRRSGGRASSSFFVSQLCRTCDGQRALLRGGSFRDHVYDSF